LEGIVFPESPRWQGGGFWFVDMFGRRVLTTDLSGPATVMAESDDNLSGLGFLPEGTAIVVSMHRRQLLPLNPAKPPHADLTGVPASHLNDMVIGASGRAYVDCLQRRASMDSGEDVGDSILLVDPAGACRTAYEGGLIRPNGLAICADGKTLIVAETLAGRLTAFTIDEQDGSLSQRRLYADTGGRKPDGICVDEAGAVWFGSPRTAEFVRVLAGGQVTDVIPVPGRSAIACVLGGPDRRTLLMASAKVPEPLTEPVSSDTGNLQDAIEARLRKAQGFVSVATVPVPGTGWP
jgi:sugar lactone lactonase YvrE